MENKDADDNYQNLLEAGTNDSCFEIAEENLKKVFPEKYQFNTELGNMYIKVFWILMINTVVFSKNIKLFIELMRLYISRIEWSERIYDKKRSN